MCESTDESYNIALRYRTIKKRLDNLGYRDTLSLDALPLIEKLLADLIQTTESLKHFKAIAENNIESCRQTSLSIDPYNYDNTKLVEECNQLHTQLLEVKENNLIQTKELKRKIHRLESECSDLQLASSRNLKRIKDLELESSNKSKRIQELLGKCCKPTISNVGIASKKRPVYPLKRPTLESEPLPKDNINGIQYPNLTKVNPQIVDLIAMADRKISALNYEVIKLKDELSLQRDNVDTLKTQLAMKEKEINRLKKLHDGGRSYNVITKECSCRKNEPNCGQCNFINRRTVGNYSQSVCNKLGDISEIKILQQAKLNLEQQLRDALEKQHDAMSQAMKLAERNEELEKELRDIDHVALAVEADCNSTVKHNNKRVSQLQEKLESTMTRVRELENDLLVEKRQSQELHADLESCKLENRNIQRALDNSLDEKKKLTDRINELTLIENSLNDEIGKLSKHVETQKHEIVELGLANDLMKKQTHNRTSTQSEKTKSGMRVSKDDNKKNNSKKKNNDVAASNGQRQHSQSSVESSNITNRKSVEDSMNSGLKKMTDESKKLIEQLEHDRDYYKDQWNKLNEKSNKISDTENAELWGQICDLKHQLNEKELRISELQRDKRDLCREKLDLENRAQISAKSHARSPCTYCNVCRSMSACVCPSAVPINSESGSGSKLMVARLERERDTARADVNRLIEERDILHERLKLATEAHTCEQRRLRDKLHDLEVKLNEVETEKQNLLITQGSRQSSLAALENQMEDARNELRMTKQELATQRTQYFQLRALQDQTDQALGDVQSQLAQSESELSKALERNKNLDQQQLQMDNQIMELKQEIKTLRTNMARLDREKDQLLMNLDEKTERIAVLEREVSIKEQQTLGVDHQLRDLQHKNQICVDQCAEQQRQLRNMQMEIENYQRELDAANAEREHAMLENKRLQNDMAAITCDSRRLQHELEASRAESFDLKRQLQTYVSEVRRVEDCLNKKENERTEMLNHFRSLSLEATILENNNHSLESEAAEAKGALHSARDRVLDLEGQLVDKDCQIRRHETQVKELTEHVASLEVQVRQQIELRSRTESDLNALRDLCVQLDKQKDSLKSEVENCTAMKTQYDSRISRLMVEQDVINEQRQRDNAAKEKLEKLLDQETAKSMDCQRKNQELQNEIRRLKYQIEECQSKLSAASADLKRYQNQAAEYSKQIAELRREVTNERFNRAKKEEEHRRSNQFGGENIILPENNSGEPASGISPHGTFDPINAAREVSHSPLRPPNLIQSPESQVPPQPSHNSLSPQNLPQNANNRAILELPYSPLRQISPAQNPDNRVPPEPSHGLLSPRNSSQNADKRPINALPYSSLSQQSSVQNPNNLAVPGLLSSTLSQLSPAQSSDKRAVPESAYIPISQLSSVQNPASQVPPELLINSLSPRNLPQSSDKQAIPESTYIPISQLNSVQNLNNLTVPGLLPSTLSHLSPAQSSDNRTRLELPSNTQRYMSSSPNPDNRAPPELPFSPLSNVNSIVNPDNRALPDQSHSPLRHQVPIGQNEPIQLNVRDQLGNTIDPRIDAERTNRFEPGIGMHKDIHIKENGHGNVPVVGPIIGEPAQSIAVAGLGSISVKATVEEDANHKDIRLQITEEPTIDHRQPRADQIIKSTPISSTNYKRKETPESSASVEVQVNQPTEQIREKKHLDDDEYEVVQIGNEILLKPSGNNGTKQLVVKNTQSKINFNDLLTNPEVSNANMQDDKQPSAAVDHEGDGKIEKKDEEKNKDEKIEKKDVEKNKVIHKEIETQTPQEKKTKGHCGCEISHHLPGCNARERKDKSCVEIELRNENNVTINDQTEDNNNKNTNKIIKTPEAAITFGDDQNQENYSLEKVNTPAPVRRILIEDSQSSEQNTRVPVTITYPNSSPVQINLEENQVEPTILEIDRSDLNEKLAEVKEMSKDMRKQFDLLNTLKSKHSADTNNTKNHHNISGLNDPNYFEPVQSSSPNSRPNDRSVKKTTSKKLDNKSSRSTVEYRDKTKIDYPSDDENGERYKISRSRTLVVKSNDPSNKQHTAMRQKDEMERGSSGQDKKTRRIDIKERDRESRSPTKKIRYETHDVQSKSFDDDQRDYDSGKCQRCPLMYKNPSSPRRSMNHQAQASPPNIVEASTSYSQADAVRSWSRVPRRIKSPSPEKSSSTKNEHHPPRSKFCEFIMKGPAKCFVGSSSSIDQVVIETSSRHKSSSRTRNLNDRHQSRSPSKHQSVTREQQSSPDASTAATCTVDSCYWIKN